VVMAVTVATEIVATTVMMMTGIAAMMTVSAVTRAETMSVITLELVKHLPSASPTMLLRTERRRVLVPRSPRSTHSVVHVHVRRIWRRRVLM